MARLIGMCTHCFLCCCCGFPVILITAILRFNVKGRLAALSKTGSEAKEVNKNVKPNKIVTTERTFEMDADLIFILLIVQFAVVSIYCCGLLSYSYKKEKRNPNKHDSNS